MASFFYVIVPASVARELGLEGIRQTLPGGSYLLTQKDFSAQPGDTLSQRIAPFGGIMVSEAEATQIQAGIIEPPMVEEEPEEEPEEKTEEHEEDNQLDNPDVEGDDSAIQPIKE